ncbi:helix-turn-helix domain-containing protein [Aurantimonas sp. MSK8Z-1]|uniref:helix-turn-helix domain-containing protein n=1 Tax=Mangrovibrevibacter kandeliae TaxID=2968473 RepID=UPI0021184D82|nr:helix-turn-helix domain-containing protein [Aurantimonas sp. MSK8Z-1]MCW4114765.1 helix-turn-helix domain-containing protein [Aurantimonas sp. MSK8Z-1]
MSATREAPALRRQLGEARERIRQLEGELAGGFVPPEAWGLTRGETVILQLLVARPLVSMEAIRLMLWPRERAGDEVIYAHVVRLRRKLAPLGVAIESKRHVGYWLVDRERVLAMAGAREGAE